MLVHILYLIHFSLTWRTQTRNMMRSSDWSVVRKTRNMARTSDWSLKQFWIKMFRHTLKGVKVVTSYAVPTFRKLWFPFIGKPFVLKPPFLSIFQSITVQSPSLDLICQNKINSFFQRVKQGCCQTWSAPLSRTWKILWNNTKRSLRGCLLLRYYFWPVIIHFSY